MKKEKIKIKYTYPKKKNEINNKIDTRYKIIITLIIILFSVIIGDLFYIQVIKNDYFIEKVKTITTKIVEGDSTPRGRIYDRNHKLIVDNKAVKVIAYKKPDGITTKEEIEIASLLAKYLEIDYKKITDDNIKNYWLITHEEEANKKITEEEYKQLEERKITNKDLKELKINRITKEDLEEYNDEYKETIYIYTLMNKGYSYAEKVIKNESVTDLEYATIAEHLKELNGVNNKIDWDRTYPYDTTFKSILGSISTNESGLPKELKDHYLDQGYSLNDRVGTSYLEYQYEDILKGKKNKYKVVNGDYYLLEEGTRGNDIVLTIDIELQQEVDKILESEIMSTKSEPNTKYYNKSFVIISNPKTGEILAMSGKQAVEDKGEYKIYDYTPGITTSPVVVGSVVKGASHIVGYNEGALKIGEIRDDSCIKIASTPIKCSWKYLGVLDDISALKMSSNTYQYNTAIKVGHGYYSYDNPLKIDTTAFDKYRNTFNQFGLGVKTNIDLPVESLGYKGESTLPGHLLDFSIGQYDTYTPIQLSQYIGTIANNGVRIEPHLLKEVYAPTQDPLKNKIQEITPTELNKVDTQEEYMARVKEGFKKVLDSGTGYGYIDLGYKPAGKTGTSQSFIDTDGDKIVDTETLTTTFVAYAPYDDPVVTFTVISPDIYYQEGSSNYQSAVNKRIVNRVSQKFFEIFK